MTTADAGRRPRVVALGGGRGLSASLAALRRLPVEPAAVVSVADDGASSGKLRAELGVLPPGDFRKALVALAADEGMAALFEHRFASAGALDGHAVGNLLLAGLFESAGDPATALARAAAMVGADATVLPMADRPLALVGRVGGTLVRGQAALVATPGRIGDLRLEPADAPASAAALRAVRDADAVVLGPGSWFTSVLPHLLLPDLAAAVAASRVVLVLNLTAGPGETAGMGAADHLAALARFAPDVRPEVVLADPAALDGTAGHDALRREAESRGGRVMVAPMAAPGGGPRHDALLLAAALRSVLGELLGVIPETAGSAT
ncbi:MAG TPA: uridine diphosphate-N-acetylglucosamine-binding protein YvcK [Mycobacteriales bacterium]